MRRGGEEFPVELAVTRVDVAGAPLFTGHLRDITERTRARERLAILVAPARRSPRPSIPTGSPRPSPR